MKVSAAKESDDKLADVTKHSVRSHRFDEDRFGETALLQTNGQEYKVLNISESGVAFLAPHGSKFDLDQTVDIALYLAGARPFYEGSSTVVALRDGGTVVLQFYGKMIGEGMLNALEAGIQIRREVAKHLGERRLLPADFLTFLHEVKTYLSAVKARIDAIENETNFLSLEAQTSYQKAMEITIGEDVIVQLRAYSTRLFSMTPKLRELRILDVAKSVFREELIEFYRDASFLRRAWEKPLGYAGDYEMMNQIYRNQMEGKSLFGRLMHKWGINEASSKSVRYRTHYIVKKLQDLADKGHAVKVGCLASGPAREVIEFLKVIPPEMAEKVEFILMDQDHESLLNAKRGIAHVQMLRGLNCKVRFIPLSVKDIIDGNEVVGSLSRYQFDFIYTMGLYDYLRQGVAKILTNTLLSWLRSGGHFVTGNFSTGNTTHSISDFVADWRLILRTEDEMRDLADPELVKTALIHVDEEGIDLFLEAERK